jgi:diguanylate cyclase (GGDEF)-like protein/PAS domain S-box-containing protein
MLARHVPSIAVDVQYGFVLVALMLAFQHVLARLRFRANAVALWSAVSSAALAAGLGANLWLFEAPPHQFDLAMLARDVLLIVAAIVQVPTIAALAGKPWPRRSLAALVLFALARAVVWQTTDLVYAHRTLPNGAPVYGPLLAAFTAPEVLLLIALVVRLARGWGDRVERWVLLTGYVSGVAVLVTSFSLGSTPVAELLTGYWIIPWVVALQVLFGRRVLRAEAATRALTNEREVALASLARTERLSRLALRSGNMGWFEYDPGTGRLEQSPELAKMFGTGHADEAGTVDDAVALVHPDDRQQVRSGLERVEADGAATAEARLVHPDGKMSWVELSALKTVLASGREEVVGVVRDVTDRKRSEAEQLYRGRHDALTGLPNRAATSDRLRNAVGALGQFSLVLMDLDDFKDINDTLGHPVGDEVLVAVARRLGSGLREGDFLARFGGDEFAVVVPEAGERATDIARRLLGALHDPVQVGGVAITVRASAGVVCAPDDGVDADTLLRRADSAMYSAKRRDVKVHRYGAGDDQGAARRLQLAGQLSGALSSAQVQVHYQPTLELAVGRCDLLEALVRWYHPVYGLVPPLEFVPLAEQYGLGFQLLRRVLSDALAECASWRAQGLARSVAVNVSPRTLVDPGLPACVSVDLARFALPGEALVLEMTEDAFAGNGPGAGEVIAELNDLGVKVAIDDFGTGYSSLAYLKQLPVSTIKLDQSFVGGLGSDASDDAIVSLAIDIGHQLGLSVIGEGVETAEQFETLSRYGCDAAQGYWICRPGPPSVINAWLASHAAGEPTSPLRRLRAVGSAKRAVGRRGISGPEA